MPFTYGSVFSAEARNGKGKKSKKKGFEEYLLVAFVVTTEQYTIESQMIGRVLLDGLCVGGEVQRGGREDNSLARGENPKLDLNYFDKIRVIKII